MTDYPCVENGVWRAIFPRGSEVSLMPAMPRPNWPVPYSLDFMPGESTYIDDYNATLVHSVHNVEGPLLQQESFHGQQVDYNNTYAPSYTNNTGWPAEYSTYYNVVGRAPAETGTQLSLTTNTIASGTTESDESDESESQWSESDTGTPEYCGAVFRALPVPVSYPSYYRCHCNRPFGRPEHLRRHLRTVHGTRRDHRCKVCKRAFSRTDNLRDHYWSHVDRGGRRTKNDKFSIDELKQILGSGERVLLRKLKTRLARHQSSKHKRS
jgi:hypothetical protein